MSERYQVAALRADGAYCELNDRDAHAFEIAGALELGEFTDLEAPALIAKALNAAYAQGKRDRSGELMALLDERFAGVK